MFIKHLRKKYPIPLLDETKGFKSQGKKKKLEILINHYNLWFVLFEGVQL